MSEEEAVKILQYKVNNVNNDVYIGELDKQNIEAIKVLLKFIEQLQQENEHYKYILTEFEKWLEERINLYKINNQGYSYRLNKEVYDKLQELKEGKK